jgi:hypothetical protein
VLVRFAPSLAHLTSLLGGISADVNSSSSSATTRWLELTQDTVAFRVGGAAGTLTRAFPLHSFEQVLTRLKVHCTEK